jgi:hypothetical protein
MKTKGVLLSILLISCIAARADYPKPAIYRVPLYRLVVNLETIKETDPKDPHNYYALGRLYAMAFAQKQDTLEAILRKGEEDFFPYYGIDRNLPHFFAVKTAKDTLQDFPWECLDRAILNFRYSLSLDTTYVPSLLGLAWCLEQKGNREEAIKQEKNNYTTLETAETAGYLIKLLDQEKDKAEIDQLQLRIGGFKPNYMISPVLIPLGETVSFEELTDTAAHVKFDLDGTGFVKEWEWISDKAGWLVYRKGDETIENAMQLFGNRTFNIFWDNGYKALASLDDNRDGLLSGSELVNLAVWQDRNKNGISENGELHPLSSLGITALNCDYEESGNRLLVSPQGVQLGNGRTRPSYDWFPRCVSKSSSNLF